MQASSRRARGEIAELSCSPEQSPLKRDVIDQRSGLAADALNYEYAVIGWWDAGCALGRRLPGS